MSKEKMAGLVSPKSIGLKRTALGKSVGKSNGISNAERRIPYFAMCLDNRGNEGSLQVGKVYRVIRPEKNDRPADVRIIDDEGEDYLYSKTQFVAIDLPTRARKILLAVS